MSSDSAFWGGVILLGLLLMSIAVRSWPWRLAARFPVLTLGRQFLATTGVGSIMMGVMAEIVVVFKLLHWWPWGS